MAQNQFDFAQFNPAQFNPFSMWTDMASRTTEMLMSSGQQLGERFNEMTRTGSEAGTREVQQVASAGGEGLQSAAQSGLDLMTRMQGMGFQLLSRAWQQWFSSLAQMSSTMTGGNFIGEAMARQERLFDSLNRSVRATTRMAKGAADEVTEAAAKPARAVSANAKRQGGRVSRTRVAAKKRR